MFLLDVSSRGAVSFGGGGRMLCGNAKLQKNGVIRNKTEQTSLISKKKSVETISAAVTMKKSNLYTGTGDRGMTSLATGERVRKDSVRLEAYGTVDEFSAHLGILESFALTPDELKATFRSIQNRLFDLGAYLATGPSADNPQPEPYGLGEDDIEEIERAIDRADGAVAPMHCFVLPGGCLESAQAHVARTVCRRAERRILTLAAESYVSPLVITYFNRLSDLLFAVARLYNSLSGVADIPWRKKETENQEQ